MSTPLIPSIHSSQLIVSRTNSPTQAVPTATPKVTTAANRAIVQLPAVIDYIDVPRTNSPTQAAPTATPKATTAANRTVAQLPAVCDDFTDVLASEPTVIYQELASIAAAPTTNSQFMLTYSNGDVYTGHISDDQKRHGFGIMRYHNGTQYEGFWQSDIREGFGIETELGNVYVGEWVNNTKKGRGVSIADGGSVYEGKWENNRLHGKAVAYLTNGNIFHGEWVQGQRSGAGTLFYRNGKVQEGLWHQDRRVHIQDVNLPIRHEDDAINVRDSTIVRSMVTQEAITELKNAIRRFRECSNLQGQERINARRNFMVGVKILLPQIGSLMMASYEPGRRSCQDICLLGAAATDSLSRINPNRRRAMGKLFGEYYQATTDEARARALDGYWEAVLLPDETPLPPIIHSASSTSTLPMMVSQWYRQPSFEPQERCSLKTAVQATNVLATSFSPVVMLAAGPIPAAVVSVISLVSHLASLVL